MLSTSIQPQSSPQANYTLDGSHFYITQETKYLGVVIQLDLKFTSHIYTKISKTGQQLGIIRRTLYPPKKKQIVGIHWSMLSIHKYAAAVWDPNPRVSCTRHRDGTA